MVFARARRLDASRAFGGSKAIAASVSAREPTLWRTSFVRDWRAMQSWTAEGLAERIPWVAARAQRDGEFVLTNRARGTAPLLQGAPAWEPLRPTIVNVSVSRLLARTSSHSDHVGANGDTSTQSIAHEAQTASSPPPPPLSRSSLFFYYSGTLDVNTTAHWRTPLLWDEVAPAANLQVGDVPLVPEETAGEGSHSVNQTATRLWLTSGRVLARTHYDKSHNLLAVVRGRKRIVLWPPEEIPSLQLYPAIHAAYRQSQVSMRGLLSAHAAVSEGTTAMHRGAVEPYALVDASSLLGSRGARSVELGEGDLLYIPPYWSHAVESPEPSVALASFSTSWEEARWARSKRLSAPLGRFVALGVCSKARGAALTMAAFLHAAQPALDQTPRAFLAQLYASRYAPLYGNLHAPLASSTGVAEGGTNDQIASCLRAAGSHALPLDAPEHDVHLRRRIGEYAASVADLLVSADPAAGGRFFGRGIATELAGDYVEELAGWACGAEGAWRLLRWLAITEEMDAEHRILGIS